MPEAKMRGEMKAWLVLVGFICALWLKQRLAPDPLVEIQRRAESK